MVLDRALVAAGDEDHVGDAGGRRLLHRVLDQRLVDDRQHLLGARLGRRQEPGAEAGDRKHGLGDFLHDAIYRFPSSSARNCRFVEDRDAELLRPWSSLLPARRRRRRSRSSSTRCRSPCRPRLDRSLRLVARQRRQRAGQHECHAGELARRCRAAARSPASARRRRAAARSPRDCAARRRTARCSAPAPGPTSWHFQQRRLVGRPSARRDRRNAARGPWRSPRRRGGCRARR